MPDPDDGTDASILGLHDPELLDHFRATRCESVHWMLASALYAGRADRVVHGLVLTRAVNAKMRSLRLSFQPLAPAELERLGSRPVERTDLVAEAVGDGLTKFRDRAILGGEFRADGGASLTTYCTNTVITCLPSAVRRWRANCHYQAFLDSGDLTELEVTGRLWQGPDGSDAAEELLELVCADLPLRLVPVLAYLRAHPGSSFSEAAASCGVPRSTANTLWRDFRERQRTDMRFRRHSSQQNSQKEDEQP